MLVVVITKENGVVDAVAQLCREPDNKYKADQLERARESHTHQPVLLVVLVHARKKTVQI